MNVKDAYNLWAVQYDGSENRTRDLEAIALRKTLDSFSFENCLEVGCGTGKNTSWLVQKAKHITAVDFSEEMLSTARKKIDSKNVLFVQADITKEWKFTSDKFDLIAFSLVLEHIQNLDHIFAEVSRLLLPGGYCYIGELHPFKQYAGSKARFETEKGLQVLDCFTHHLSDFIQGARQHGLLTVDINEYFDDENRIELPRILTMVLKKP